MPPITHDVPTLQTMPSGTSSNTNAKKDGVVITVDNVSYAVPNAFLATHPGGEEILRMHSGREATDVFTAFHGPKGHAVMRAFPRVETPPSAAKKLDAETRDFRALRERVEKEGWLHASSWYYAYKLSFNLAMFAVVGGLCVMFPGQLWAIVLASLVLGSAMSQCGWLAHDFLHHQVFTNRNMNNLLGMFVGGVLQGYGPTWWKMKHNTHHAVCNVHEHDPDINTVPIVAWSDMDVPNVAKQTSFWRFHLRHQSIMFPIVLCFAQFSWRLQSAITAFTSASRHPVGERIALTIHYAMMAWMALTISTTWWHVVMFVVLEEVFGSYGKAVPFVLNHGGCPVVPGDHNLSFLRLQVVTSRDVNPSLFMDWFMGGLNYQIEHHLFPTMPRHNLAKIKPIVIDLCKKHNIPYASCSFTEGYVQLFRALSKISDAM